MAKRSAETAAASQQAKHLRSNLDESKKVLDEVPLVHWRMRLHKWEWLVETTDMNLSILQRGIERMQSSAATQLGSSGDKVLTLARETLDLMNEGLGLVSGGKVDSEIEAMELFVNGNAMPASPRRVQVLDNRLIYDARVKDVKAADRDGLLAEKMRATQAFELPGSELTVADAVVLTTDFLQRARSLKALILEYEDPSVDAKDFFRIQTQPQLKNVIKALRRHNYSQLWQSAKCMACMEQKLDTFQCDNIECGYYLCSQCFADTVCKSADEQHHDLERLQRVARLSCFYCRTGTMASDICRAMPEGGFDAFLGAVEVLAQAEKATDAAAEKTREVATYQALPTTSEKLFLLEKTIISGMIAIKCPSCMAKFGSFTACCSLTCTQCDAVFCALCLGGPFENDDVAHAHVLKCVERPDDMTDLFLDLDKWNLLMQSRQQKQIRRYLDGTDLPHDLKQRLLDFFAPP